MPAKLFISYSHKDEELRNRFEIALAMLRRQELIEPWHDRRLLPGDEFGPEIDSKIDEADVIVLLISPDFLHSDYCYKIEKHRALERYRSKGTPIVSVILRPCDWQHTELAKFIVTPTDGKPVTRWPDLDEAFQDVTASIRRLLDSPKERSRPALREPPTTAHTSQPSTLPRSSNLRVARQFTQEDLDRFTDDAFEFMAKFFEGSLAELQARNPGITTRFKQVDANRFTAAVYRDGKKVQACTIFMGGLMRSGGISYVNGETTADNGYNESLTPKSDSQSMFLQGFGMAWHGGERDKKLTMEGAAEMYWEMLIQNLQ